MRARPVPTPEKRRGRETANYLKINGVVQEMSRINSEQRRVRFPGDLISIHAARAGDDKTMGPAWLAAAGVAGAALVELIAAPVMPAGKAYSNHGLRRPISLAEDVDAGAVWTGIEGRIDGQGAEVVLAAAEGIASNVMSTGVWTWSRANLALPKEALVPANFLTVDPVPVSETLKALQEAGEEIGEVACPGQWLAIGAVLAVWSLSMSDDGQEIAPEKMRGTLKEWGLPLMVQMLALTDCNAALRDASLSAGQWMRSKAATQEWTERRKRQEEPSKKEAGTAEAAAMSAEEPEGPESFMDADALDEMASGMGLEVFR